ncbi:SGNH/GDSL hydrolase family protein [Cyclobacterium sp. 1_MG-2023]|uniref:SGNH/GDSL hydrolase family protein n=1 Tax=Cyclobacterium sp. 1_MG-2023 TaxID=3062681 RepID=UPI0026E126B8|nr:SGNH/GDSL hydrolase family protein [Cyclobacterium sp. 1_MG-2023]MDO6437441.1 SGNH/GDSL hydrolase family protein [Cyclobacterium sp. 1_MG-2023]
MKKQKNSLFKYFKLFVIVSLILIWKPSAIASINENPPKIIISYHNATDFKIIGKVLKTPTYSRLPVQAEKEVRPAVWSLSKNSAGLAIRFSSNSSIIKIRWTLKKNRVKGNMTPIASNGLDLYAYTKDRWQFVGVAIPGKEVVNEATVIADMTKENREYLLNLPLYEGVEKLEIGIEENATISMPRQAIIDQERPVIFYGTSITQGASASRPGLTYAALLERKTNKEVINLGFSGNGRFEKEVAQFIMPSNPSVIILDCTPNSAPDTILTNLPETLAYIQSVNDSVPIILVESIVRDYAYFKENNPSTFGTLSYIQAQNDALKKVYLNNKNKNLFYVSNNDLIGQDNEATVDGTHFNDLGNYRMYQFLLPIIEKLLTHR